MTLTGDSTIRLVRFDGLMLIGDYTPSAALEVRGNGYLESPRVVGSRPRPQGGQEIAFMELVGRPTSVPIPDGALVYIPTEEDIVNAYKENVTGLTLAKPALNVIPIGGRA